MAIKVVPHSGIVIIESICYDDDDSLQKFEEYFGFFFCHGWLQLSNAGKLRVTTYEINMWRPNPKNSKIWCNNWETVLSLCITEL